MAGPEPKRWKKASQQGGGLHVYLGKKMALENLDLDLDQPVRYRVSSATSDGRQRVIVELEQGLPEDR